MNRSQFACRRRIAFHALECLKPDKMVEDILKEAEISFKVYLGRNLAHYYNFEFLVGERLFKGRIAFVMAYEDSIRKPKEKYDYKLDIAVTKRRN